MAQDLIVVIVVVVAVLLIVAMVVGFAKGLMNLGVPLPSLRVSLPDRLTVRRRVAPAVPDHEPTASAAGAPSGPDAGRLEASGEPGIVIIGGQPIAWSGHADAETAPPPVVSAAGPADRRSSGRRRISTALATTARSEKRIRRSSVSPPSAWFRSRSGRASHRAGPAARCSPRATRARPRRRLVPLIGTPRDPGRRRYRR